MTPKLLHFSVTGLCAALAVASAGGLLIAGPATPSSAVAPPGLVAGNENGETPTGIDLTSPPSAATATSNTWTNGGDDGVTQIYNVPVNYLSQDNSWQPIDSTLVASPGPRFAVENEANSYVAQFPEDPSTDPMKFNVGDEWVSMRLRGTEGDLEVEGSQAEVEFPESATADSAVYTATATGVKEEIKLDSPPRASDSGLKFSYQISVKSGISLRRADDDWLEFRNPSDEIVAMIPPPLMWDSNKTPEQSSNLSYTFEPTGANSFDLTLTVDRGWLLAEQRQYPVTIDPTITNQPPLTDCWIREDRPTDSYCGNTSLFLRAGRSGVGAERRSILKFNTAVIPDAAQITDAKASFFLDSRETSTGIAADYALFNIGGPFTSSASWRASGNGQWTGGDPGVRVSDGKTLGGTGENGYKTFTNMTAKVRSWVRSPETNHGVVLKFDGGPKNNTLGFVSGSPSNPASKAPFLQVVYTDNPEDSYVDAPPPQPTQYSGVDSYELDTLTDISVSQNISIDEAVTRYAWMDDYWAAADRLEADYPESFSWAEARGPDSAPVPVVGFDGPVPANASSYFQDVPKVVDLAGGQPYDATEIGALADAAVEGIASQSSTDAVIAASYNTERGVVEAELYDPNAGSGAATTTKNAAQSRVDADPRVDFTGTTPPNVEVQMKSQTPFEPTSLRGGVRIARDPLVGQSQICTSAFSVYLNDTGAAGLLTARHCEDDIQDYSYKEDAQRKRLYSASRFLDKNRGDIQFHPRRPDEKAQGTFYYDTGKTRNVTGQRKPRKGAYTCWYGRATQNADCQRIARKDIVVKYGGAFGKVEHMFAINTSTSFTAAGTDSGGPVYNGGKAMGVISGIRCDGNCIVRSAKFQDGISENEFFVCGSGNCSSRVFASEIGTVNEISSGINATLLLNGAMR